MTLVAFVDDVWAPRARRRLAPKTWERDSIVYARHIRPTLGEHSISEIDIEDLAEWQDGLEEAGVGAPTLIKAMSILSGIFAEAARRPRSTGVHGNPVGLLRKPPTKRRSRPLVWGPVVVERVRFELIANSRRIGPGRDLAIERDALLVSLMELTGCRPGEALGLRWSDIGDRIAIVRRLSGRDVVEGTKAGRHWVETDWRNYRSRHFRSALERVEAEWDGWRRSLGDPAAVRESVAGLTSTRPYDLGRHTHSALMLAAGMSLQRLARIQGHGIRVLDPALRDPCRYRRPRWRRRELSACRTRVSRRVLASRRRAPAYRGDR